MTVTIHGNNCGGHAAEWPPARRMGLRETLTDFCLRGWVWPLFPASAQPIAGSTGESLGSSMSPAGAAVAVIAQ